MKHLFTGYKLVFALLGFSSIITEIAILAERGTLNLVNFFSYFTIQTNVLVVATLLLSALGTSRKLDSLRTAVTVYILVVGIGFSLLLANIEGAILTAVPWDNIVLHYIMPIAMLVDFIVDRPGRVPFTKSLMWLLFPLAYAAYSLIRGQLTGWYPYPFLNPAQGYTPVVATLAGLLVLTVGLLWVGTKLTSKTSVVER